MSPADDRPALLAKFNRALHRLISWIPDPVRAGLAMAGFAILLFSPADAVMDVQLDASNYGSYAYFTSRHFQFGSEVLPMAGPYGFVPYGFTYAGFLFWDRLALELLTKLALGALILWFFLRASRHSGLRWAWLLGVLGLTPAITDLPYILAILLAGLFLIENYAARSFTCRLACTGVSVYLALLTLFKGTQTMLAMATLGLLIVLALSTRNFLRLAWIVAAYLAGLVGLLLGAGQGLRHLPGYFHGILELSSGYTAAMGLDETWPSFCAGICVSLALVALVSVAVRTARWNSAASAGALLLLGVTFSLWKHGFVRADGHMFIFFQFAPILALTTLLFHAPSSSSPESHRIAIILLGFITLTSFWADGKNLGSRIAWNFTSFPPRLHETCTQLLTPTRAKARLDDALAAQRLDWQLPHFRQLVGRSSIDFFGNELGYLLLNRFNYQPRPMGGGTFNVFTPWLRDQNVAWLQDPRTRPEYFAVHLQTIDERFAAQDDAGTLLALMHRYVPIEVSAGLILFKAKPGGALSPEAELVATHPFSWNEPIPVPAVRDDEMLLITLEAPLNLAGKVREALYKAPLVFLDLPGSGAGLPENRRVIPLMFEEPVPLNPILETNEDLLGLLAGRTGKIARTVLFKTRSPGFFDRDRLQVRFYRMPRPPVTARPPVTLSHSLVSSVDPESIESDVTFLSREDGLVYQVLVPPGKLSYRLKGDETELHFTYGMTSPTYELPTDGVEVSVDLQRPGQPAQLLYRRVYTPRQRPEQRGPQSIQLTLPPFPSGSVVNLSTGRGPDNDGAWDLVYLTKIGFNRGSYTSAQFPGFNALPQSVSAGICGRYAEGTRDIFLLHAPGALRFTIPAAARSIHFKAGLLAGAYTGTGLTDGVEILVELHNTEGSTQRLLQRRLDPRLTPGDRGDQSFDIPLPPRTADTQLVLSIDPGPSGDASWDWSYVAGFELH